jgi:hypothetical protein
VVKQWIQLHRIMSFMTDTLVKNASHRPLSLNSHRTDIGLIGGFFHKVKPAAPANRKKGLDLEFGSTGASRRYPKKLQLE